MVVLTVPLVVFKMGAAPASTVTVAAAVAWSTAPRVDPASSVWPRRMTVARGFARHTAGIDPATEIPPVGLIPMRQRWSPPMTGDEVPQPRGRRPQLQRYLGEASVGDGADKRRSALRGRRSSWLRSGGGAKPGPPHHAHHDRLEARDSNVNRPRCSQGRRLLGVSPA